MIYITPARQSWSKKCYRVQLEIIVETEDAILALFIYNVILI